jgi:diguanylate cyclase (GGDEF)-like protein/putative nucleotidyltransferase with HDIG domain
MARRHGHNMAIMIMDIDYFKAFNDSHGHMVGDRLLKEFASLLRNAARTSDIVARYGGDEFVIILPETDLPAGLMLGDRVLRIVSDHVFCADSLGLRLTTSIGVATSRDIDPDVRAGEMLRLADLALYEAKREGRNRVRLWSAGKGARAEGVSVDVEAAPSKPSQGRILLVDDEPLILEVVTGLLRNAGYEVDAESSAPAAFRRVESSVGVYDIVVTDLSMPDTDGFQVLDRVRLIDSMAIPIVLTGKASKDAAIASLRHGAFEFIEKPVRRDELLAVIERARDHRRLRIENDRYRMRLEDMVRQKSAELSEAMERVKQSHEFTLQALAGLLDAREQATGRHSLRVRDLALIVGAHMGMSELELGVIGQGALLHDIGKIAVPDAILLKAGSLTEDEWKVMRTHSEVGYNILKISPYMQEVAELVYSHQERFDGTGYPRGIKGEDIPMGARLFAVVDAYDAMRSHRPYRRAMTSVRAVAELKRCRGTQFDPKVIDAFLDRHAEIEGVGNWPPE